MAAIWNHLEGMAIFHFSVKILSRSKGRSAIAAAAYRHAIRLLDGRTGLTHDFRRKSGVAHSEIMGPREMPAWATDRLMLWNSMERAEKRRDAQLCREIEIALPAELTEAQRLDLVRSWVKVQLTDRGIIADIAIHAPGGTGDHRNFHAHIMTTLRGVTDGKIGPKKRSWGNREMVIEWRRSWAAFCNRHLEQAGVSARIDHRSLKAQGIDRTPTKKIGQAATAIDRKRGRSVSDRGKHNAAILAQNRQRRYERVLAVRAARQTITREISHCVKDSLTLLADVDDYPQPRTSPDILLELVVSDRSVKAEER